MAFSKAPNIRFNEKPTSCAPSPTHYNPKLPAASVGVMKFAYPPTSSRRRYDPDDEASQRALQKFQKHIHRVLEMPLEQIEDVGSWANTTRAALKRKSIYLEDSLRKSLKNQEDEKVIGEKQEYLLVVNAAEVEVQLLQEVEELNVFYYEACELM